MIGHKEDKVNSPPHYLMDGFSKLCPTRLSTVLKCWNGNSRSPDTEAILQLLRFFLPKYLDLVDEELQNEFGSASRKGRRKVGDDADMEGAIELSLDLVFVPQGRAPVGGVTIRDPVSKTTPKLPEVVGKGNAIVTEEQVAHSLIDMSKKKRTTDQFILVSETEAAAPKGDKDQGEVDSSRVTSGTLRPTARRDQNGSNLENYMCLLAGPNLEHMDDEFLATAYPKMKDAMDKEVAVKDFVSKERRRPNFCRFWAANLFRKMMTKVQRRHGFVASSLLSSASKQHPAITSTGWPDSLTQEMLLMKGMRKEFYINKLSDPFLIVETVRSQMRILSVISVKVFEKYGYNYLREIILRRADYQEYKISEKDFKNLHPNDFEDLDILKMEMEMEIRSTSDINAQDGNPVQDDVRLCLSDDLKKAQDHSQGQV
ncbi:hypothetical protein Tco_0534294 [Tanacetum coccineum]